MTTEELRKLKRYYVKAAADIERDIAALYAKYATENGLSMTAARKLIRGDEFKSWRLTLEEYVRKSKVDPKILRELNTLTARSRISRLEALHARTLMETIDLAERLQEAADAHLARAYLETYYGNLYDFHKTIGLSTPPNAVDAKRVESVLQTAWVGKNYSARIWANQAKLADELEATMLQAIHRGSSIQQLSKALSRRMDVAYSNAERLIRTELNAVENRASAAAMKAAEFTHYQFMATLDRRTCARCGERDGEVYKLSEMNQGENAPPMHARCRCTIVAYDGLQYGTRAARDFGDSLKGKSADFEGGESGGKKIKTPFGEVNGIKVKIKLSDGEVVDHYRRVPADMSYRDWKAVYIDKTKSLETWQAEFDARRKSDEQSPLRQRGRAIIDDLAAGRLPTAASGGKVGTIGTSLHSPDIKRFSLMVINTNNSTRLNELLAKYLTADYVVIDETSTFPMLYNVDVEKIVYNPKHPDWGFYDKIKVATHEIAHSIDYEFGISISLKNEIAEAVSEAEGIIFSKQKYYEDLLDGDLGMNMAVSDLVSAFTDSKIYGAFAHKPEYWNIIGNKEREIVAELATIFYTEDQDGLRFVESFPKLKKMFEEVKKYYEQFNKFA